MRKAQIFVNNLSAGILEELAENKYRFSYQNDYSGVPISLTLPVKNKIFDFDHFPTFFEGLLPEGEQLSALLRKCKIDKNDYFGQLLQIGGDVVGAITIMEIL